MASAAMGRGAAVGQSWGTSGAPAGQLWGSSGPIVGSIGSSSGSSHTSSGAEAHVELRWFKQFACSTLVRFLEAVSCSVLSNCFHVLCALRLLRYLRMLRDFAISWNAAFWPHF